MYHIRYTREIKVVLNEVAEIHEAEPEYFSILWYQIMEFLTSFIAMPIYAIKVLLFPRMEIVKNEVSNLLIKHYGLVCKK
jgi:hypothetical protein